MGRQVWRKVSRVYVIIPVLIAYFAGIVTTLVIITVIIR